MQVATVGVVSCLLVGACSSSSGGKSASAGTITLNMQISGGGQTLETMNAIANAFTAENPTVKVKFSTITNDVEASTNQQILTGANPPDLGFVGTNDAYYSQLVAQHRLVDLAPVWQAANLANRAGPDVNQDLLAADGKHYLVPSYKVLYNVIYYNKDLFTQAGITPPTDNRIASASDLYAMVNALKSKGKQGLAIGGKSGFELLQIVSALLPTIATSDQLTNYNSNWQSSVPITANYTDAPFVDTLSMMDQYNKKGVFARGFLGVDEAGSQAVFEQGRAGMLMDGIWAAPLLRKAAPKMNLGWMLFPPIGSQKTQLTSSVGSGYVIPTGSKHQLQAEKFLEFLVSDPAQQLLVKDGGLLPVVNTLPASALSSLDPLAQEMVADNAANGSQFGWADLIPGTLSYGFADPLIQAMFAGSGNPQSVAAKEQAALLTTRAKS